MPGRDVRTPVAAHDGRGSGFLVGAALAAAALLAIGIALGSRIASSREPIAPGAAAASGASETERQLSLPTRRSTTRTPAGAVAAAAHSITAFDGDVLLDPARLRAVVGSIAFSRSRSQLLAAFSEASAHTRAKLGADTVPRPVIVLRSVPVGYRIERFSPLSATVSVWYVGIVGSGATVEPQQSWRTQLVELVWERGAWRVSSFASSSGPTPPLSNGEVGQPPGDLFIAIPRFEEFNRAGP